MNGNTQFYVCFYICINSVLAWCFGKGLHYFLSQEKNLNIGISELEKLLDADCLFY